MGAYLEIRTKRSSRPEQTPEIPIPVKVIYKKQCQINSQVSNPVMPHWTYLGNSASLAELGRVSLISFAFS
jgi:hypothetical protein